MKETGFLWVVFGFVLLSLMGGCSDYDDQPGLSRAAATSTHTVAPTVTQFPTPSATPSPTAEPGGWVWVQVGTALNPEQRPVEVCKEDQRSCTWFEVTESGCAIDKVEMQMETTVYDYQIACSCDNPPRQVWPGEEYRLSIACSGDLRSAAEGNSWIQGQGAISYYYLVNPAQRQFLQPFEQQFWFRPWHPDYDGITSNEWVFFGPWGELGDEFELVARCGEAPCQIHWRYQLQVEE